MKGLKLKLALCVALLLFGVKVGYADEPTAVAQAVAEMVEKYDDTKGVDCMVVTKGNGLGLIKMMLNSQFGKSFMKGVTSISIIDYGKASEEVCESIRTDANVFISLLEEFDLSKEKRFEENSYLKCFAARTESGTLSDFVIVLENKELKSVMYMAGEIKVEE